MMRRKASLVVNVIIKPQPRQVQQTQELMSRFRDEHVIGLKAVKAVRAEKRSWDGVYECFQSQEDLGEHEC